MKRNSKPSLLFVIFVVIAVFTTFATVSVEARKHNTKKSKTPHKHSKDKKGGKGNDVPPPELGPQPGSSINETSVFNLMSFGAKGDGVSDDSEALVEAWRVACKVYAATVLVPGEFKFLVKPVTLQGPCMPQLTLQIDGTLLAPEEVSAWPKSCLYQWLNFKWVHKFTIKGNGVLDGQGFNWWNTAIPSTVYYLQRKSKQIPDMKPTALRFYSSSNVTVRDIQIINSPQCHLKFDGSNGIKVNHITISSPESSPNTDGIHLQNTQDVEIQHSNVACGDDCVSIQTGCSNVHVHHVMCGPGHGISIGGLGKDKTAACVSGIIIENVELQNTLAGVRMKTWQGGTGLVKNITFSNIQVYDVKYPIIIDQYYCDKHLCKNQSDAVAISGVTYKRIIGTYKVQPIYLACSDNVPCTNVDLIDIQLKPSSGFNDNYGSQNRIGGLKRALCWNSYGKSQAPLVPSSIDYCLRRDIGGLVSRTSHEHVC